MATGYMGFEEPAVAPKGPPISNELPKETLSNPHQEPAAPAAPPADAPKDAPVVADTKPPVEGKKEGDTTDAPTAPQVVEKIVEKIVEKYPEFKDENSKTLYEAWVNGEMDKVKAYWREMDKNYDTMSHIDVIREGLAKKNTQWTPEDVELELRSEYGEQLEKYDLTKIDRELEPEAYEKAEAHNKQADRNLLKLQRDARDFRITLKESQKAVELPKIKTEAPAAASPTGPTPEQLDEAKRNWAEAADKTVALTDYKFSVGTDKDPEEVVFAITPEDNAARKEAMKTWNGKDFMSKRGWQNEDGSFNLQNIAKDVHVLENIDKIAKSSYSQGLTNGRKAEVAKIKNIDNEQNRQPAAPGSPVDAGDLVWG